MSKPIIRMFGDSIRNPEAFGLSVNHGVNDSMTWPSNRTQYRVGEFITLNGEKWVCRGKVAKSDNPVYFFDNPEHYKRWKKRTAQRKARKVTRRNRK